jgi:CHAD domain-containing protein
MTLTETRFKTLASDLLSSIAKMRGNASVKDVHRLRTSTRRMESFIDYLHPQMTRKQEDALQDLSALRKRAGRVRDLDVQMDLLKQGISNSSANVDRRRLTQSLQEKRDRQLKRLLTAARKIERSRLFIYLQRIEARALAQPDSFGDESAPLRQAETQLTELAAEFVSHAKMKPRRLHALRTRMKLIRYQAELAAESNEQKQFLERMKSVQDVLGEWHDWEALCAVAEKFFRDRANCPLLVEARALRASKYSAATSALTSLLDSHNPARKQPSKVHLMASIAKPA